MRAGAWREHAACTDLDVDVFFDADREAEALAVCEGCPVRADCLDAALTMHLDHGVYGGATEAQRAELVRLARWARRITA